MPERTVLLAMTPEEARAVWQGLSIPIKLLDELEDIPTSAPLYGKGDLLMAVCRRLDHEINHAPSSPVPADGETLERYRRALVSIQCHAMMDDNAASMVWTARAALYDGSLDDALRAVPEKLRALVAARLSSREGSGDA